ncbi:MAG: DUF1501 domain-containing protein [Planctomycetota bacterium]
MRDRSVVFVYLSGGASQIETFNPNMDEPAPYRSLTGEVPTSVPGLTFGGTFPRLAKHANRLAVIKSFRHPVGDHDRAHVHVLSGGTDPRGDTKQGRSIGSLYSRFRGANHPRTGMPTYALLTEHEIDGQYRSERSRVSKGSWPGDLGAGFAPFVHDGFWSPEGKKKESRRKFKSTGSVAADMELSISPSRLGARRELLAGLDRLRHRLDIEGFAATQKFQELAIDLVLGSASRAFDLSNEDPKLLERYDTRAISIGHKVFRPSTLGHQMLLARRLCEQGCGFVTVHSAGWDMHADANNPPMVKGMNMLGTTLDQALSTFLEDVKDRGLSDKILLVVTGDFGRTPKINKNGGRDHWANLCPLLFADGGLQTGGSVGRSNLQNSEPASTAISPRQMMGTILHSLFDMGELRVARGFSRDVLAMAEDMPVIEEIMA